MATRGNSKASCLPTYDKLLRQTEVDRVYSRREAEQILNVSSNTFYRHIRYQIPIVQYSARRIGIRASDLAQWVENHLITPKAG